MHFCSWNLLEMESNLSQFWNVLESKKLTQDAISKLEEALLINPRKYDALWCWEMLRTRMRQRFQKVLYCFQKAFNGVLPLTNLLFLEFVIPQQRAGITS
ncbi:mitochondrial import receptor subunit TOM20-like [Pyrus ussuriensis x Pyrus communis]|uniref:Mitochondrial import receptor subunit TOM20-like n=1 Tax=Pyrus ussuriensis x Pyrus communis TaxID=2448454 RepID=A0A5N5HRL5_9ROSA|nr:mitochondrial import receptor subunit TOM20-like [Pyrus ussuriensis x Pyrus communis]